MIKTYTSLLSIAAGILLLACSNPDDDKKSTITITDAVPVRIVDIQQETLAPVIQTSGLFTTDDETYLAFKTGGVIEKILVKEGDAIRKGQLLATLNLTEIEAQVAQARLSYEKSKRDFQRVENLYKDSVATLEQFQNARTGMEVAARQLESADFNRSYSEIRAMANGFVLRKLANEGQVIGPGIPIFQTNGANEGRWILKAGVSDREWSTIQIGDKAEVYTDTQGNKKYEATVTRKSEGADVMNGSFMIDLTLKSPGKGLATGLFGKASIMTTHKQAIWKVPYDALLDGDAQSGYVFITNDQKTAQKVNVVVGSIEKNDVIILAGLDNAKHLIVSGSAYLKDKAVINVIK